MVPRQALHIPSECVAAVMTQGVVSGQAKCGAIAAVEVLLACHTKAQLNCEPRVFTDDHHRPHKGVTDIQDYIGCYIAYEIISANNIIILCNKT